MTTMWTTHDVTPLHGKQPFLHRPEVGTSRVQNSQDLSLLPLVSIVNTPNFNALTLICHKNPSVVKTPLQAGVVQ